MPNKPHYIPEGFRSITPTISVENAAKAIDFYKKIFGATELLRIEDGNGKVGHCELMIGDSKLMVSDIFDDIGGTRQHAPFIFGIHLYVENSDAVCEKALAAGAKLLRPLDTKFYGDKSMGYGPRINLAKSSCLGAWGYCYRKLVSKRGPIERCQQGILMCEIG